MIRKIIVLFFMLCPYALMGQSIEINYLTGGSLSLYGRDPKWNDYIVEIKNTVYPFVNFVGEASVGYNFYKGEKLNISLAYNQLVYSYGTRTFYTYPDFFAKKEGTGYRSSLYINAISAGFGPNIKISPKIIFRPFLSCYMVFKSYFAPMEDNYSVPIPTQNGAVASGIIRTREDVDFKTSVLLGIGFKFNFFVTKWLYFVVGSRYNRGFRKDFRLTYTMDLEGEQYKAIRQIRSSNFSVDLGIGAKFSLKKKSK